MSVSIELIKTLRDETGVSIGKCKQALEESNGDMDEARKVLAAYSESAIAKKADRELGAGIIASYIHSSKIIGSMIELNCETDYVAKNDDFVALANDLAIHITAMDSKLETIMDEDYVKNPEKKISDLIAGVTQKLGERIQIGKIARFQVLGE